MCANEEKFNMKNHTKNRSVDSGGGGLGGQCPQFSAEIAFCDAPNGTMALPLHPCPSPYLAQLFTGRPAN